MQLVWNDISERKFESGVDRCVLYVNGTGFAWNGIVSINDDPASKDLEQYFVDGQSYVTNSKPQAYAATIEAFSEPEQFSACYGERHHDRGLLIPQQYGFEFGLCYRTRIGNAASGADFGYRLHLVYNATAKLVSRSSLSWSSQPDLVKKSWEIKTRPSTLGSDFYLPTSKLTIDSTKMPPPLLKRLEQKLYGTPSSPSRLDSPADILNTVNNYAE